MGSWDRPSNFRFQTRRTLRPHHLRRPNRPHLLRPKRRRNHRRRRAQCHRTRQARPHCRTRRKPCAYPAWPPAARHPRSRPGRHAALLPSRRQTPSPKASPSNSPPPEPSPTTGLLATSVPPGWATGTSAARTRSSTGLPTDAALGSFYQVKGRQSNGLLVDGPNVEVIVGYSRDHDRNVGAGTFTTKLGNRQDPLPPRPRTSTPSCNNASSPTPSAGSPHNYVSQICHPERSSFAVRRICAVEGPRSTLSHPYLSDHSAPNQTATSLHSLRPRYHKPPMTGLRESQLLQAADLLLDARRTGDTITDLPGELQPADIAEA